MANVNKRIRRQAFHGWWKWIPAVCLSFSVVYFDCWLSTQRRLQDFELYELERDIDAAQRAIEDYTAQSAELETLDRLDSMAPILGLKEPDPGQVEIIHFDPVTGVPVDFAYPFSVARADASESYAGAEHSGIRTPKDIGSELPEVAEIWDQP